MRHFKPSRVTVPARAHPLVQALFAEMIRQRIGFTDMGERSGVSYNTIRSWRGNHLPNIANLEACFNVLGLTLHPITDTKKQDILRRQSLAREQTVSYNP